MILRVCRDHVGCRKRGIEADRQRIAPLAGAQHVAEHPHAEPVAGEMIEQQRRRFRGAGGQERDRGEFFDRIDRCPDAPQLPRRLDKGQPFAQVAPRYGWGIGSRVAISAAEGEFFHGAFRTLR